MSTQPLTTFSDEVLQGHRDAFQALRQILADALLASCDLPDNPAGRARHRTLTQRLSLRLRAAVAILRVRPATAQQHSAAPDTTLQALAATFAYAPAALSAPASSHPSSLTPAAGAARQLHRAAGQGSNLSDPTLSNLLRAS